MPSCRSWVFVVALAATAAIACISSTSGFSRYARGEPPTKIRLAARETIKSEFFVIVSAISRRLFPERK